VIVVLDASPVSLLAHPQRSPSALACRRWVDQLIAHSVRVCVPEIADYEVRREAIRRSSRRGLDRLDGPSLFLDYLAITTTLMRRAAALWAEARNRGVPTADRAALDADVIVAAQAQLLREATGNEVVIATDNIRHLGQFAAARGWQDINP
jgi:predicted nucleic acid-binding protein